MDFVSPPTKKLPCDASTNGFFSESPVAACAAEMVKAATRRVWIVIIPILEHNCADWRQSWIFESSCTAGDSRIADDSGTRSK